MASDVSADGDGARAVYASRTSAIDTHLFLLCPNNSGSTFLIQALGECAAALSLAREGQHVFGFAGPTTRGSPWALIWGGTEESRGVFSDPAAYDWDRTKRAWYLQSQLAGDAASVFVTKSPPFLLIADALRSQFANTRFLIMVRNPYAMIEGILRRRRAAKLDRGEPLAAVAARHVLHCLERQKDNAERHGDIALSFTYEKMCADPAEIERRIVDLVPALADLDIRGRQKVKNLYDEPLRNMNAEQIARLAPDDIAIANRVFAERPDLLAHFGYAPI